MRKAQFFLLLSSILINFVAEFIFLNNGIYRIRT